MLAILPGGVWIILFLIFSREGAWRRAFIISSVAWGLVLVAITEAMSLFQSFTLGGLLISWGLVFLTSLLVLLLLRKLGGATCRLFFLVPRPALSPFSALLCLGCAVIVALVGLIAGVAAPNNWDSMTYHLARVVHWIQNRGIHFYPTHILRQLHQNPGAEFILAHLQLLSGGDRLANLVQWLSMVGSILGVTLIARQLGAGQRGQVFAAVFCATLPVGILQASSTQNDHVAAFWLVCFVHFVLRFRQTGRWTCALGIGASLGLAVLTKATAYLYALPFLVWFILSAVRVLRWCVWKPALVVVVLVLFVNTGHWARNFELYGSPLGPGEETPEHRYANDLFSVSVLISNVARNTALHLGTPSRSLNAALQAGIERLHAFLGLEVNDPRTTWGGTGFQVKELRIHEDSAGNPLHLLLLLPGFLAALAWRRLGLSRDGVKYLTAVVFAFLLFCFYLRWQPWHSRLHLPLFVLWSPLVAMALGAVPQQKLADLIAVLLLLGSWPWIAHNQLRPLIGPKAILGAGRISQYFAANPALELPYTAAAACVSDQGCKEVGLSLRGDDWEYPIWVLLPGTRFDHVDVKNPSAKLGRTDVVGPEPCAILCLHCSEGSAVAYARQFESAFRYGPVYLFIQSSGGSSFSACPPGDVDQGLAQSYAATGQEQADRGAWDLAAAYYRLAVANWPAWGLAHTRLGNAYRARGQLDLAEAEYRRSIEVEPDYVGAYINLGGIYEGQGRGEEAWALYQQAVEIAPDSAWAHSALGSVYLREGDPAQGLAHLERAVQLEPDNVTWLLTLADAYRDLERHDDATAAYRQVLALDPGNTRATQALQDLEP